MFNSRISKTYDDFCREISTKQRITITRKVSQNNYLVPMNHIIMTESVSPCSQTMNVHFAINIKSIAYIYINISIFILLVIFMSFAILHEIVVTSPIKVNIPVPFVLNQILLQSLPCCDSPHSQLTILNFS